MEKVKVETHNIDAATDVDINTIKLSDLTIISQTGRSTATGFGVNRTVNFRAGINCRLGNVEQETWQALAEQVVARDLGEDVLEKMEAYVLNHGQPIVTYNTAAVRQAALSMCTSGLLRGEDWEEYEDFLADYPELADTVARAAECH